MPRGIFKRLILLAVFAGTGAAAAYAQDSASDMAAWDEKAAKIDPEDWRFVEPVCTRCHTAQRYLGTRSWPQWQNVFRNMIGNGAVGTPEQWDHIYRYFGRNLTDFDVNNASEDEISAVLGVSLKTAIDIVDYERPFASAAELEAIPGVNKAMIEQLGPRLLFLPRRKH